MVAVGVMALIAAALSTLAVSVEVQGEHVQGTADAVQHARVVIDRIQRTLRQATATEQYPGYLVVPEVIGTDSYPHTLVVWRPTGGKPANAAGPPLWSEIVVFAPDAANPGQLVELSDTTDTRPVPAWNSLSSWRTEIAALRSRATAKKTVLTPLVRSVPVINSQLGQTANVSAARFEVECRPLADVARYRAGTLSWENINWVQDLYSSTSGTCQAWCRIELQLMPGEDSRISDPTGKGAIPFFGSGAMYFQVTK